MQYNISLSKDYAKNWITRKNAPEKKFNIDSREIRIVDLFCGCGGLTAGIIEATNQYNLRTNIVLAVDNNSNALNIYNENFSNYSENIQNTNIIELFPFNHVLELNEEEVLLKNQIGSVDILVGGPPCQGHSDLNNSTRRNDPRNILYLSCIQAIKVLNPEFVVIENVPSVIHSKENVVHKTKELLNSLGYEYKELKIDFLRLGIPQSRKRHILVASRNKDFISDLSVEKSEFTKPKLIDYIGDLEGLNSNGNIMNSSSKITEVNKRRIDYLFENNLFDLPNKERPKCHKEKKHSYNSNYGRLNYNLPAQTLTSGFGSMGQGRYVHPTQKRTLSIREAARIQGFPDDHIFNVDQTITALRKMIANAVPPQLSFVLTKYYLESISMQNC